MGARGTGKSTLRAELVCRACGAIWKYIGSTQNTVCPYCGKPKDARDRREYAKGYDKAAARKRKLQAWYADPDNRKARGVRIRALLRKQVFFRITGTIYPSCARCGCDDPRLLEVNHKAGGGNRNDFHNGRDTNKFYYDVASGRRTTEDLELLCKPCNAIHSLEMKYGLLPMKVTWSGSESK